MQLFVVIREASLTRHGLEDASIARRPSAGSGPGTQTRTSRSPLADPRVREGGLPQAVAAAAGRDPGLSSLLRALVLGAHESAHHAEWRGYLHRLPPYRQARQTRALFDAVMEFGLQSTVGRTLEQTGSVVVEVDAGESPHWPASPAACSSRLRPWHQVPSADGCPVGQPGTARWPWQQPLDRRQRPARPALPRLQGLRRSPGRAAQQAKRCCYTISFPAAPGILPSLLSPTSWRDARRATAGPNGALSIRHGVA
jgi:hypothetical protein